MAVPTDIPAQCAAWLKVDRESGRLVECSAEAIVLLGQSEPSILGYPWHHCLAGGDQPERLDAALKAGNQCLLVPFTHTIDADEIVLSGVLLPSSDSIGLIFLWPLLRLSELSLPGPHPADVVAVLGVESLNRHAPVTPDLMSDIRDKLFGILRSSDHVSSPVGSTVVIFLKDVELDAAADISRALLSHLRGGFASVPVHPTDIRLAVGMAKPTVADSALMPLLRANRALLFLRQGARDTSIHVAGDEDNIFLDQLAVEPLALFSRAPRLRFEQVAGASVSANSEVQGTGVPMERGIEGYVSDNMEGAVDQAVFLAGLDMPIAVIGPGGTGKLYIARIIQQHSRGGGAGLDVLDCREFRGRRESSERISAALNASEGKTLVFKSPHLMSTEVQLKLARQIGSRTLADTVPARAMPRNQMVALFPDDLERLVAKGRLHAQLATVFAGYPIHVPPIKDRKQAVLRWAHKILAQEAEQRSRTVRGFTSDAEQAMQRHNWPGNITEMRQCIIDAVERSEKEWITPVDLGLYKGLDTEGTAIDLEPGPFLRIDTSDAQMPGADYLPSSLDSVDLAMGQAVNNYIAAGALQPLGTWAVDEVVLAALDRYRDQTVKAAKLLQTGARNVGRWLPKIHTRDVLRQEQPMWQECRRTLRDWVREMPLAGDPPLDTVQDLLLTHLNRQSRSVSVADRAAMLGISVPTYHKRLRRMSKVSDNERGVDGG